MNDFNNLFGDAENFAPLRTIQIQDDSPLTQILNLIQEIKRDNTELRRDIKGLKEELKLFREESDVTQKRLLTEILFLKKNNINNNEKILPKTPFAAQLDLINFENMLRTSPEKALELEEEMYKISIHNSNKFIRNVYKLIFTDELANTYSWRGTSNKPSIRVLMLTSALKSAYNRRFNEGEKIFEAVSIKWFQTAHDRLKVKNKKKGKRGNDENDDNNDNVNKNEAKKTKYNAVNNAVNNDVNNALNNDVTDDNNDDNNDNVK